MLRFDSLLPVLCSLQGMLSSAPAAAAALRHYGCPMDHARPWKYHETDALQQGQCLFILTSIFQAKSPKIGR